MELHCQREAWPQRSNALLHTPLQTTCPTHTRARTDMLMCTHIHICFLDPLSRIGNVADMELWHQDTNLGQTWTGNNVIICRLWQLAVTGRAPIPTKWPATYDLEIIDPQALLEEAELSSYVHSYYPTLNKWLLRVLLCKLDLIFVTFTLSIQYLCIILSLMH